MRVLVAGLVGGIVMFCWGAFSHMVLPLGDMGLKELPNEAAVTPMLTQNLTERGVYLFPSEAMTPPEPGQAAGPTTGPFGFLAFDPDAPRAMAQPLIKEFASNVLAAIVAAIIASWLACGYGGRVMLIALMGMFAWLSISASHWTWWRFADLYTLAEGIDQTVGWLLAGLAIAGITKGKSSGPATS